MASSQTQKNKTAPVPAPVKTPLVVSNDLQKDDIERFYGDDAQKQFFDRRNELLKDIPYSLVRKAWFTMAHILLAEKSRIIVTGCDDGQMAFIMAALYPQYHFTGIDKDKRKINKAAQTYDNLPNLDFVHGALTAADIEPASVDAIINSDVLHSIYSNARYNDASVAETIREQFKALKPGGVMFIRDYAKPAPDQYVLLEMPDKYSSGDDIKNLSEPDLLVWYSQNAQPKQDPGCGGFFLEELPPRTPNTRLFRLPYKWAYEFIMRKDNREMWEKSLPVEYTFFTEGEFLKELSALGARVEYSTSLYEESFIEKNFDKSFHLMDDAGKSMGYPSTGFVTLARKLTERKSLNIAERRPSSGTKDQASIQIHAMRNEKNGQIVDVVTPTEPVHDVIPYRIDENGRLRVYLHESKPRGLANAVMRNGKNIDTKRWSGHMIEAINVRADALDQTGERDVKETVLFARDHLGLRPQSNAVLQEGPDFYPSPDYIDERIFTFYLEVQKARGAVSPKSLPGYTGQFLSKGDIREFDAQQVLNAITVGIIPNARLELQLLGLFENLQIPAENWVKTDMGIAHGNITGKLNLLMTLKRMKDKDTRFKQIRGTSGQLRSMNSIFVEEGQTQGASTGLTARDMDFIISDEKTVNTAVVVPLSKDAKGDLHAGFAVDHLPVPQRHEGNGLTLKAPSFNIPDHISGFKDIRAFVAESLNVTPDMVVKMGESYYTHIGITPHRIYPFAVARPPGNAIDPSRWHFLPIHQFRVLWKNTRMDTHLMTVISRAFKMFNDDIKFEYKREVKKLVAQRFESGGMSGPDWSVPISYVSAPGKQEEKTEKAALTNEGDNMSAQNAAEPPTTMIADIPAATPVQASENTAPNNAPQKTLEKPESGTDQNDGEPQDLTLEELEKALNEIKTEEKPSPEKW